MPPRAQQSKRKRANAPSKPSGKAKAKAQEVPVETEEMMDQDSSSDDDSSSEDELTFAQNVAMSDDDDQDDDQEMEDVSTSKAKGAKNSVNVDFVFLDPREEHFHSIKQLLLSYLPSSQPFDVSGLANLIIDQVATGTMVCIDNEPDVYGFVTALSLRRYEQHTCIQQIVQYVTRQCPADQRKELQIILQTRKVGLLLNERIVNLPYQLVPAMQNALQEDIAWAKQNEEPKELRESFDFEFFLLLGALESGQDKPSNSRSAKKKTKGATENAVTARMFVNFEDEFAENEAQITFTIEPPQSKSSQTSEFRKNKTKVAMLVDAKRYQSSMNQLSAMINT